jgi:DNA-binding XRE family transcriptional regulator
MPYPKVPTEEIVFNPDCLKSMRVAANFTQQKLANAIGLSNMDTIRRWENGECEPSLTLFLRAVVVLGDAIKNVKNMSPTSYYYYSVTHYYDTSKKRFAKKRKKIRGMLTAGADPLQTARQVGVSRTFAYSVRAAVKQEKSK